MAKMIPKTRNKKNNKDMTNVFTCLMKKKFGNGNGSGMNRDCIGNGSVKSRKLFALLTLVLTVGVGNVWGKTVVYAFDTSAGLTALGITEPEASSGTNLNTASTYTLSDINMSVTHGGSTSTRVWNSGGNLSLKTYNSETKHATITFSSDLVITKIYFRINDTKSASKFTASTGTLSFRTWTGSAKSVTFTSTDANDIKYIAVSYLTSGNTFAQISNTDDLSEGDEIILVGSNSGNYYAIAGAAGDYYNRTSISVSDNKHTYSSESDVQILTVSINHDDETDIDYYSFHDGKGYLLQPNNNNYLRTDSSSSVADGTKWSMSVTSSVFTIRSKRNDSYYLQHNNTNNRFATYTNSQQDPYIFKKQARVPDHYIDIMHGNEIDDQYDSYSAPSIDNEEEGSTYEEEKHYKFVGWVTASNINEHGIPTTTPISSGSAVTGNNTTYYAVWNNDAENDAKIWCEPNVTVSGDIHLTSYNDAYVQSSSKAKNALNVTSTDWGSATSMEIAYLGAGDVEVAKASSHFRLYGDDTNTAIDATSSSVDISGSRTFNTNYSIRYTPNAYNTTHSYKLQLTFKKGEYTLKTVTHNLHGRGLPQEFVIALKDGDYWYALPNNLQTSSGAIHSAPIKITVDNTTTPTTAVYAATTTVYKGKKRSNEANNKHGIRFTSDDSNHLQGSSGVANAMWLASGNSDANQSFYLKSTDFGAYLVTLDTASNAKQIGIYTVSSNNYIGYTTATGTANIYFLPITNKYTPRDASAYEWGEHGVIVESDMTDVASATMHIDGNDASAATVTGVNGSLGSTKYTKVDGGALTIGAVANDGKLLYIHWKNSGGTEIAASQITMPCVIAANTTMSTLTTDKPTWAKKEVHILPGKTLTADGESFADNNVTVPTMYVYPGATLDITTGKLTATTLRLRSGWTRAGTKKYDVARVHIASGKALSKSTFTLDYDIYDSDEGTHYYPIAVPFHTLVKNIDYLDETLAGASEYGTHYVIKRYDGASRAENGAIDDNWVAVPLTDAEDADVSLQPSEGYIMTGVGIPAYGGCIIRFPLDASDNWTNNGEKASYSTTTRNVIAVTHHEGAATAGGGANVRHEGWNMLANPYLSCFATKNNTTHSETDGFIKGYFTLTGDPADPYGWDSEDENIYVSVPTHDFSEYIQSDIDDTELLPGWSFFIQAAKDGNVTFAVAGQQSSSSLPIYAPRRNKAEESPILKTGIVLSSEEASDKTTFLISDRYNDEYEIGADLEKMFGNGYTLATYSLNNDTRLAFNAMSNTDAQQTIPIGVRLPEDGEYTFSLNDRYADADIERLDLIDYETSEVTNLLASDYIFSANRSQDDSRFALHVVPRKQTPTDIGDVGEDRTTPRDVRKILLNGTMYIVRDGLLFDATGKRVQTIQ